MQNLFDSRVFRNLTGDDLYISFSHVVQPFYFKVASHKLTGILMNGYITISAYVVTQTFTFCILKMCYLAVYFVMELDQVDGGILNLQRN